MNSVPLDDLPPLHRELAQDLGLVRHGRLTVPLLCPCCFALMGASCARCQGIACVGCNECQGCHRIICDACNADPDAPRFAFPGDRYLHPHSVRGDWKEMRQHP